MSAKTARPDLTKTSRASPTLRSSTNSPIIRKSMPTGNDVSKSKTQPFRRSADGGGLQSHFGLAADPLQLELNNLENIIKVKEAEVEVLNSENKSLKQLVISKDKGIEALRGDLEKLQEVHLASEKMLSEKVLELKAVNEQKKAAFASQAAAEAVMRRIQSTLKDDPETQHEAVIAALEAELKLATRESLNLADDIKAQERNLRAKEAALLKAEAEVEVANEKAAQVEVLQNLNVKLERQVEICEEENKTLDRMYQTKVEEVKVLSEKVAELDEALLVAGGAASTIKANEKRIQELEAELKFTSEELARAKVAVNRVAVVVANEWKDEIDRVIPVQRMMEERKLFQKDLQSLREKLALAEKSSKYESQMKEKYQSRLRIIEDGLKSGMTQRDINRRLLAATTASRNSTGGTSPASKSVPESKPAPISVEEEKDLVSGALYGHLEKEVVNLRKAGAEKDQALKDKEDAIEMLSKKVELLSKALESETKKSKREMSTLQREMSLLRGDVSPDLKKRSSISSPRGPFHSPLSMPAKKVTP